MIEPNFPRLQQRLQEELPPHAWNGRVLKLVFISNKQLPEAITADAKEDQARCLADLFALVASLCNSLDLDFATVANNFDPDSANEPESDPMLTMFGCIGEIAEMFAAFEPTGKVDAAPLKKLVSVLHWFCFNNDWSADILAECGIVRMLAPTAEHSDD